MGKICCEDI